MKRFVYLFLVGVLVAGFTLAGTNKAEAMNNGSAGPLCMPRRWMQIITGLCMSSRILRWRITARSIVPRGLRSSMWKPATAITLPVMSTAMTGDGAATTEDRVTTTGDISRRNEAC